MEDVKTTKKPDCTCSEEIASLKCALQAKDDKIRELQKQNEILTVQVEKLNQEREELESKLEENLPSDIKESYERPPTQEKCFNISDLSLRNELKDKCEELERCLNEKEFEYNDRIQKLEELILQKDKVEKEWKARFRKTDKEREDAILRQKKLEIENSNLKGQLEVFQKVLPDITSHESSKDSSMNSSPANRRSSRNRVSYDSEKRGTLWHTYEDESSKSPVDAALNSDATKVGLEPGRSSGSPQSASDSLNRKVSDKSPPNRLWQSHSGSTSELGDSISTCKMCSQSDFHEVPPLIQNICKIVRGDNILDTEVLLELHKYERGFSLTELVSALTLLTRILKEKKSSSGAGINSLKRKRESGAFESDKNSPEKVRLSKTKEPEQLKRASSSYSSQRSRLDATESESSVHKNNYQQLYNLEKKRVACLQSKLMNSKNLLSSKEEQLKNLQFKLSKTELLRDTYLERCRNITKEYELKNQELTALKKTVEEGRPAPIIKTVVKTIPPPPCDTCTVLNQKLSLYRQAKKESENRIASLNDSLKVKSNEIDSLKQEICKLYKQKNELEEKLSDPAIVSAGVYSPSLKTIRDKLMEARYMDVKSVKDDPQESGSQNISSITNCSFTVPSADGFVHGNRNQTQLRAFCKAEDEAEMLSQSSIFERQSDTPSDRLYEINRRNTLCLPHLKSQYPLELDMTPSQHKYFQPPASTKERRSIHLAKKRKISKPSERFCSSFASLISNSKSSTSGSGFHHSSTPKAKKSFTQSMHKTNTSAARLQFRRSKSSTDQ